MMKYASVTDVVRRIKEDVYKDYKLQSVAMEGNIIGLKRASNGHYYMNLRDDNCSIHAILFAGRAGRSMDNVCEGDHVVVIGAVQVYEKAGSVSFIIERLFSQGVGKLQAEYEKVKKELAAEGYFDTEHKKPLPRFPWTIGILTSKTGAVLHDIHKIAAERNPYVQIELFPIPVQGVGVETIIAQKIASAGADSHLDVLILARGGGSMEDLWCFNHPAVVQAIYHSEIPIITAIGHETDTTLADYAADVRAATPTHAAELAIPSFDEMALDIAEMTESAYHAISLCFERWQHDVIKTTAGLQPKRYDEYLILKKQQVEHLLHTTLQQFNLCYADNLKKCAELKAGLEAMNPILLVRKGYGQLEQDGHIISDIHSVSKEKPLYIQLVDGLITTDVKEVTIHGKRNR
ncbi:Exodeoxyribonuclease VII large subunit [Megasphaera paucivorans]|uniref:Exodeoxyribonuclease 7 large subunit n=2 Tax=Megasphaera paucivorans TaxID=349095 RepID=A0A1G9T0X2_9FIRM|nr:Exodeoxyribonuclease VII large subunit [Megasphaera paucivorans]